MPEQRGELVKKFKNASIDPGSRSSMPDNWQWGQLPTRENQFLRYGFITPENPRGHVIIGQGLFDFTEKYAETIRDLVDAGYAVSTVDWRNQGGSSRDYSDRRHHDDFHHDVEDAHKFLKVVDQIPELQGLPKIALTHSLGGNIMTRVMHENPDAFKVAVHNAPMFDLPLSGFKATAAKWVLEAANFVGLSDFCPPFMTDYSTDENWQKGKLKDRFSKLTSSEKGVDVPFGYALEARELRMQTLTYGIMRALFDTTSVTKGKDFFEKVKTPSLLILPSEDQVVSGKASKEAATLMPNAKVLEIQGSKHDTLSELPIYRNQFLKAFDEFVTPIIEPAQKIDTAPAFRQPASSPYMFQ